MWWRNTKITNPISLETTTIMENPHFGPAYLPSFKHIDRQQWNHCHREPKKCREKKHFRAQSSENHYTQSILNSSLGSLMFATQCKINGSQELRSKKAPVFTIEKNKCIIEKLDPRF